MPRRALEPGVAALGQQLVVAGGFDTSLMEGLDITKRVDVYDTIDGTWRTLPDAPVAWTHINLASIGTMVYLLGGLEGAQYLARSDAFALDTSSNTWIPLAPMDPADARGASGIATAPGHIYLIGGTSSTAPVATCLDYDIAADHWTHLPDLPAPRSHLMALRLTDGTLIAAGGLESFDSSQPRNDVWALPPPGAVPRMWTPRKPQHADGDPNTRGGCAYGFVLGQLVCAGGESPAAARRVVESYDPYNDVWATDESMPQERAGTQGAAIGGRLYVPGGAQTLTFNPTDTLYIYQPLDTATR